MMLQAFYTKDRHRQMMDVETNTYHIPELHSTFFMILESQFHTVIQASVRGMNSTKMSKLVVTL